MADRSSKKIFKYPGGFIKSEMFHYDENDRDEHIYVIVWGEIIYDPKVIVFKNGKKRTEFAVRYRRGGHIIVYIWGDTPAADEAIMLKAKERIIVFGIINRHKYVNRKGENKEVRILSPHFIIPCDRLLDIMNMTLRMSESQTISNILDSEEADEMESAGDYFDRMDESQDGIEDMFK